MRQSKVFLGLALLYLAARIPFLPLMLRGEEGIFADIFLNQPVGPLYQQIGRINGETVYSIIAHPALIYETLAFMGNLWRHLVDYSALNALELTMFLRLSFASFEWLIWLLLFVAIILTGPYCQNQKQQKQLWLLLLLSMIWPASLLNTTNINIDATVGVWSSGFLCFAVMLFRNRSLPRLPLYLSLAGAAFFFGFGKNELSLVFQMAMLTVGIACMIGYRLGWMRTISEPLTILLVAILANLAGNGFNYWFDPINYQAGWGVLSSRSNQASLLATRNIGAWLAMTLERQSYLFIHQLFWAALLTVLWRERRTLDFFPLFFFTVGSALFWGYYLSYSEVGARYFEPSFIVLLFGFVVVFPRLSQLKSFDKGFLVFAVLFAIHSGAEISGTVYRQLHNPNLMQSRFEIPAEVKASGCVPLLEQADVFNRKDIDYIAYPEMADQVRQAGREVCGQPLHKR